MNVDNGYESVLQGALFDGRTRGPTCPPWPFEWLCQDS